MPRIALASPTLAPSLPVLVSWEGTQHILEGGNGDVINLTDYAGREGVFLTRAGLRGIGRPPMVRWTTESPGVDGVRYHGRRITPRDVLWPVYIWSERGSRAYLEQEERLFAAIESDRECAWRIITPTSDRRLTMRYLDDSDHQETFDAPLRGWEKYALHFEAEDPYWKSTKPRVREWSNAPGKPFFGGVEGGFGPPFYINESNRTERASIPNLGNVPAWPRWTISGPCASFEVTVGGATSLVEWSIAPGDHVVLDSDPSHRGLFDSAGRFISGGIRRAVFGSIPPGEDVPIAMKVDNLEASVSCEIVERFYRGRGFTAGGERE